MKPVPASRMQSPICSGESSMFTPKAESTSAAPDRDDKARLPCLATGTPAPATISAAQVEILNEPEASPPVPTTSIASGGACTRSIFARMTLTAPVISSTLSPRTRNAINSPPICEGVASPDIICSKAAAASSRAGAAPSGRAIPGLRDVEKIFQKQMSVLGGDAFGVELHAVHRQPFMRKPHHQSVLGLGRHVQIVRHALALDHQRMIARRFERGVDAAKHARSVMLDLRQFAMNRDRRPHNLAAEGLADRLMT